ncbi:DUF742 domain-containing protein [Thermocrispum municipale]|uniref:DUF742 domain-containing protein n=1 Tax=Thermocrispum municipale TaxID=37926 RepID=UPI000A03F87C|nr:DUF742 domain-containing protein [Thermocrispum municipale]
MSAFRWRGRRREAAVAVQDPEPVENRDDVKDEQAATPTVERKEASDQVDGEHAWPVEEPDEVVPPAEGPEDAGEQEPAAAVDAEPDGAQRARAAATEAQPASTAAVPMATDAAEDSELGDAEPEQGASEAAARDSADDPAPSDRDREHELPETAVSDASEDSASTGGEPERETSDPTPDSSEQSSDATESTPAEDSAEPSDPEPQATEPDQEQQLEDAQLTQTAQAVTDAEPELDDVGWVRPYVWTGGKTAAPPVFAMETLVSANPQAATEVVRDEHRQVLALCDEPRSVSEIAAMLSVPLGAAKALLGTMVEENLLTVHRAGAGADGPGLELMERVLRGLRNL